MPPASGHTSLPPQHPSLEVVSAASRCGPPPSVPRFGWPPGVRASSGGSGARPCSHRPPPPPRRSVHGWRRPVHELVVAHPVNSADVNEFVHEKDLLDLSFIPEADLRSPDALRRWRAFLVDGLRARPLISETGRYSSAGIWYGMVKRVRNSPDWLPKAKRLLAVVDQLLDQLWPRFWSTMEASGAAEAGAPGPAVGEEGPLPSELLSTMRELYWVPCVATEAGDSPPTWLARVDLEPVLYADTPELRAAFGALPVVAAPVSRELAGALGLITEVSVGAVAQCVAAQVEPSRFVALCGLLEARLRGPKDPQWRMVHGVFSSFEVRLARTASCLSREPPPPGEHARHCEGGGGAGGGALRQGVGGAWAEGV